MFPPRSCRGRLSVQFCTNRVVTPTSPARDTRCYPAGIIGIPGWLRSEQVAGFDRNRWLQSSECALPVEQGVLLWCMRMRVIGMKRGFDVETRIDEMLEALGAAAASPCLKDFMVALSQGCTRMIEVQCVCQTRIDADERALLDVLALAQAMRPFEALLVLRGFVTQASASAALSAAEGVGTALAQAGRN